MTELWAYCGQCARWYYVPALHDPHSALPECPVCQSLPVTTRHEEQPEGVAS